jgi:ATP-binding cassette subfamily B (MDR/TAP) protein 1
MMISQAAPHFSAVASAQAAAHPLFALIDRQSAIDPLADAGLRVSALAVSGKVELREVSFTYPTRPEAPVFDKFSLTLHAGTSNALVGPSGCGKVRSSI